jgi:hypothetical protein
VLIDLDDLEWAGARETERILKAKLQIIDPIEPSFFHAGILDPAAKKE